MGIDRLEDRISKDTRGSNTQSPTEIGCDTVAMYDPTGFLNDLFTYHSPRPDQLPKYQAIRSAAKHLAEVIVTNSRRCDDQERAITLLRQAVHMANAAVAMDGRF